MLNIYLLHEKCCVCHYLKTGSRTNETVVPVQWSLKDKMNDSA